MPELALIMLLQGLLERIVRRALHVFLLLALATSSFDIFLVYNIGFGNLRISQVLMLPVLFAGMAAVAARGGACIPIGFFALATWASILLAFVPNTTYLARSIGYQFWLLFSIVTVFAIVNLYNRYELVMELVRGYLWTFVLVAGFGVFQFLLPVIFHVEPPLVTQWWWSEENLPRINGFSYEPSFFATYLLPGWIAFSFLIEQRAKTLTRAELWAGWVIITLALVLSTSRMGWLFMAVWCLRYPWFALRRLVSAHSDSIRIGPILLLAILLVAGVSSMLFIDFGRLAFLTFGLGSFDNPDFTVSARWQEFLDTLQVFVHSPWIGYSLGGVVSALGSYHGETVVDLETAKLHEPIGVTAEVLAASGVCGFVFFIIYLATLVVKPWMLSNKLANAALPTILKALVLGLVFQWAILQFNQSILRPYLWMHIAILSAAYAAARHASGVVASERRSCPASGEQMNGRDLMMKADCDGHRG